MNAKKTRQAVVDLFKSSGDSLPVGTIVEWACGDGERAKELIADCDRYVGIDTEARYTDAALQRVDDDRLYTLVVSAPESVDGHVGHADIFLTSFVSARILAMGARVTHDTAVGLAYVPTLDNGGWSTKEILDTARDVGWWAFRIRRDDSGAWIYLRKE